MKIIIYTLLTICTLSLLTVLSSCDDDWYSPVLRVDNKASDTIWVAMGLYLDIFETKGYFNKIAPDSSDIWLEENDFLSVRGLRDKTISVVIIDNSTLRNYGWDGVFQHSRLWVNIDEQMRKQLKNRLSYPPTKTELDIIQDGIVQMQIIEDDNPSKNLKI